MDRSALIDDLKQQILAIENRTTAEASDADGEPSRHDRKPSGSDSSPRNRKASCSQPSDSGEGGIPSRLSPVASDNAEESDGSPDGRAVDGKGPEEAYGKILRLAAVREHSSASIRSRLSRDGYPEEATEAALEKAMRLSIVDDARYGDALVRMRIAQGKGLEPALREIEALGLDPMDLPSFAEYADQGASNDLDRALALLNRKPPRSKNLRDGAFRKLVSQGFAPSIASEAAGLWVREHQETH